MSVQHHPSSQQRGEHGLPPTPAILTVPHLSTVSSSLQRQLQYQKPYFQIRSPDQYPPFRHWLTCGRTLKKIQGRKDFRRSNSSLQHSPCRQEPQSCTTFRPAGGSEPRLNRVILSGQRRGLFSQGLWSWTGPCLSLWA
jgi:hypothetical protein